MWRIHKRENLHVAVANDCIVMIRNLLRNGARVNSVNLYGRTPLHIALMKSQEDDDLNTRLEVVTLLLRYGADVNIADDEGFTPLHLAVRCNFIQIVEKLLHKRADVHATVRETGFEALHFAVQEGNVPAAFLLLCSGASANASAKNDVTPLHIAVTSSNRQLVRLLLQRGARIDAKRKEDSYTALHIATESKDLETLQYLLSKGANVGAEAKDGSTPLHIAVRKGYLRIIQELQLFNADVNAASGAKLYTPLHIACESKNYEVVLLLLKLGAAVDAAGEGGITPLHVAAQRGCLTIALKLLDNGAKIYSVCTYSVDPSKPYFPSRVLYSTLHFAVEGRCRILLDILVTRDAIVDASGEDNVTPLHIAAAKRCLYEAKLLLDYGADVNAACRPYRFTPLHIVAECGDLDIIQLLLERGADIEAHAVNGIRPLHVAAERRHRNTFEKLLKHGANINATCRKEQYTALHVAAESGSVQILQLLLKHGVDCAAPAKDTLTPVQIAAKNGHFRVVEQILNLGADVNSTTTEGGRTLLHFAVEGRSVDTVRFLLKRGANVNARGGVRNGTPLHLAVYLNCFEIVKVLFEYNCDLEIKDELGSRPINVAYYMSRQSILLLLLERKHKLKRASISKNEREIST